MPYITGIETLLSKNAGDEVARTAKGWYSVYDGEKIVISGFNLKSGNTNPTLTLNGSENTITVNSSSVSSITATIKSTTTVTATSGDLNAKVNNIYTLNNANASPEFTAGAAEANENSPAMYNSMANTTNNKRLTDDVKLYVWKNGFFRWSKRITDPVMKMDAAGNYYMVYDNNTATNGAYQVVFDKNGNIYNLDGSYNKFHNNAVAVDTEGKAYGVSTNTDRTDDSAARFKYYSWTTNQTAYAKTAYYGTSTGYSLEQVYNSSTQVYDINRVPVPKMFARGNGIVYMSYFDNNHEQNPVKFRSNVNTNYDGLKQNSNGTTQSGNNVTTSTGTAKNFHVVADDTMTYKGGKYSAVGATSGGVAVVAWYDASKRQLVYSYNTTPGSPVYGGAWQENAQVIDDNYAGQYVDLFVDSNNGIHIAYYVNSSGDLKYAYLPSYNFELTDANRSNHVVTVDAYLSAGTNITINAKDETVNGTTYIVPYIAYQNASFIQTTSPIRVAWLPKTIVKGTAGTDQTIGAGAVGNFFTETWEIVPVPTTNIPTEAMVCSAVPTGTAAGIGNGKSPVLGFMSDAGYESAFINY